MQKNDLVKYRNPYPDEVGIVFRVLEDREDRVLMVALVGMNINPTFVENKNELVVVNEPPKIKCHHPDCQCNLCVYDGDYTRFFNPNEY